ncbi:MAG: hypothetical protein NXI24_24430 [bacterium]|nr:hypothetical protein [bacterium]
MNSDDADLKHLGDWKDPTPPRPHQVSEFLHGLLASCDDGLRNVDTTEFLQALVLAHDELNTEEYFSDTGQKLATRHLCHALANALNLEVNIAFGDQHKADTFEIASMLELEMIRDGGSLEFQGVLNNGADFCLYLQVESDLNAERPRYGRLYPAGVFDRKFYQSIPKDSADERLILAALRKLQRSQASPPETAVDLGDFIAAIENRERN